MTQTVSLFRQSLACRKKGTFSAHWDIPNLSIFNGLRRALQSAEGEEKYPRLARQPPE
jgi:hypothetical protein